MTKTPVEKQKDYFQLLYNTLDTPIYVSQNWLTEDKGKKTYRPGKQSLVGSIKPPYDHRSIGSNEIVLDFDSGNFKDNAKYANKIKDYLDGQEIPHYIFWSGGKGIHLHIFLDIEIKTPESLDTISKAMDKGFNLWKELRLKLARQIIEQSGLPDSLIGLGKHIDLQKLSWNDLESRAPPIRCCGGANKKVDPITGEITGGFKTWLKELPDVKPKNNTFEDVDYPEAIRKFIVSEEFTLGIIVEFEKIPIKKDTLAISFTGKYLNLPCTHRILEGMELGKRSFGAQILAVAGRLDGKTEEECYKVLDAYVKNCPHSPSPFTEGEARDWAKWIYKQPKPYWACGNCVKLEVCDRTDCSYHLEKYAKEVTIFDDKEPLRIIQEALDRIIVGENELKMQLFLLYLTKAFNPEWLILLDGPAASGKSHVMKSVASLYGAEGEGYFTYSRLTSSSLDRIGELAEQWKKKIIIIEELQGTDASVQNLRVAISEHKLNLLTPKEVRMPDGTKEIVTENKVVPFDCLFVTCNAEDFDEGEQLKSRSWILNTDTSPEQTRKIIDYYAKEFGKKLKRDVPNIEEIRTAIQFLRVPDDVDFPWMEIITSKYFSDKSLRARRDVKKLIALIKACAYFHQKNRRWVECDGKKIIIADWRDVYYAFKYAGASFNASMQGVGTKDLERYKEILPNLAYCPEFSVEDVCRWCKLSSGGARKLMSNLIAEEFFENTTLPPEKAMYRKTTYEPSELDVNMVLLECKERIDAQAEQIEEYVEKTYGVPKDAY